MNRQGAGIPVTLNNVNKHTERTANGQFSSLADPDDLAGRRLVFGTLVL
jgi:hypothetical protein